MHFHQLVSVEETKYKYRILVFEWEF